jgi:hypothetical protein
MSGPGDRIARLGATAQAIAPQLPVKAAPWVALGGGLLELVGDMLRAGAPDMALHLERLRSVDPELARIRAAREAAWVARFKPGQR